MCEWEKLTKNLVNIRPSVSYIDSQSNNIATMILKQLDSFEKDFSSKSAEFFWFHWICSKRKDYGLVSLHVTSIIPEKLYLHLFCKPWTFILVYINIQKQYYWRMSFVLSLAQVFTSVLILSWRQIFHVSWLSMLIIFLENYIKRLDRHTYLNVFIETCFLELLCISYIEKK